jgi:hypothetical protein
MTAPPTAPRGKLERHRETARLAPGGGRRCNASLDGTLKSDEIRKREAKANGGTS